MILGRNPALWAALLGAVLNAAAFYLGLDVGPLNIVGLAIIGVIANESDPTTVGTFARTLSAPAAGATSSGTVTSTTSTPESGSTPDPSGPPAL